jgi:hypothetical protein
LIGTHQLFACADDVNVLGEDINTMKKNTKALLDDSKEFGLEVNALHMYVSSPECRTKS